MLIDHNNEETLPHRARHRMLGRPLDLPEHEDGRAPHGGAGQEVRHRPHHREQRRRLGHQRSAEGAQDHRGDAQRAASPRTPSTRWSGTTRWRSSSQSGRFDVGGPRRPPRSIGSLAGVRSRTPCCAASANPRGPDADYACTRPRSSTSSGSPKSCSATTHPT